MSGETVEVVAYDPVWPQAFAAEREALLAAISPPLLALEHIGSTAVPGLRAKPVIDMMAAVERLAEIRAAESPLTGLRYLRLNVGMPGRELYRKDAGGRSFNLHVVERATWAERKERLMRDHLLSHPQDCRAYEALKARLAAEHPRDVEAYTAGKTAFIQELVDRARAVRGLPPVDVWGAV